MLQETSTCNSEGMKANCTARIFDSPGNKRKVNLIKAFMSQVLKWFG